MPSYSYVSVKNTASLRALSSGIKAFVPETSVRLPVKREPFHCTLKYYHKSPDLSLLRKLAYVGGPKTKVPVVSLSYFPETYKDGTGALVLLLSPTDELVKYRSRFDQIGPKNLRHSWTPHVTLYKNVPASAARICMSDTKLSHIVPEFIEFDQICVHRKGMDYPYKVSLS